MFLWPTSRTSLLKAGIIERSILACAREYKSNGTRGLRAAKAGFYGERFFEQILDSVGAANTAFNMMCTLLPTSLKAFFLHS